MSQPKPPKPPMRNPQDPIGLAQPQPDVHILQEEFPKNAMVWPEGLNRRNFLRLMGARWPWPD